MHAEQIVFSSYKGNTYTLLLQIPVCTTFHHHRAAYFRYDLCLLPLVAGGACMVLSFTGLEEVC